MIGSTRTLRVWAYPAPVDLRRGFEGLGGLVRCTLQRDPLSGECFLFTNRERTSAKVLFWDGTGFCIYHKKLHVGRFACLWNGASDVPVQLTMTELCLFLEGCRLMEKGALSPAEFRL